jgi:hypothetical protein
MDTGMTLPVPPVLSRPVGLVRAGATVTADVAAPVVYVVTELTTETSTAATVNEYVEPAARPEIVQLVVEVRQKNVSVESFARYFCVVVDLAEATHARVTEFREAMADRPVGAAMTNVDVEVISFVDGLGATDTFQSLGDFIFTKTGTTATVYGVIRKL